jgi:hypothetical protein
MEVDQERAVAQFIALARSYRERRLTAGEIMQDILRFFQDVRIKGAELEVNNDMLLFQWGTSQN